MAKYSTSVAIRLLVFVLTVLVLVLLADLWYSAEQEKRTQSLIKPEEMQKHQLPGQLVSSHTIRDADDFSNMYLATPLVPEDACEQEPGYSNLLLTGHRRIPLYLWEAGLVTFNGRSKLCKMLAETTSPTKIALQENTYKYPDGKSTGIVRPEIKLWLVQKPGDNSLDRLGPDVMRAGEAGPYGLNFITETDGTFIDVGANLGTVTIAAVLMHPTLRVVAVEPTAITFWFMRWNLWLNGVPEASEKQVRNGQRGVLVLNRAVTPDGKDVPMTFSADSSQDALVGEGVGNADTRAGWTTTIIKSVALPQMVKDYNLLPLRLLKLDCEGCEFPAIEADEQFYLKTVQRLGAEVHTAHWAIDTMATWKQVQSLKRVFYERGCVIPHDGYVFGC